MHAQGPLASDLDRVDEVVDGEGVAEPEVRALVAGVSPAERRHGGEGALYVALKRRT